MSKQDIVKQAEVVTSFDYDGLEPGQQSVVRQCTGEIKERLQRSAQDIWEVGQRLAEVRACLQYGQFDSWLQAEFGWSRRTAYNFINVYETFQERANLAQLNIATSALYLLAAPSTPPEVRHDFLNRAKAGEKVTHKELAQTLRGKPSSSSPRSSSQPAPPSKPSTTGIVKVIPKSADSRESPSAATSSPPSVPASELATIQPGWYRLGGQHVLFCGDTASDQFAQRVPQVAFALAITSNDWDHDWLIDQARTVTILAEADVQAGMVEALLQMFSNPQESVLFPWLPRADMLAIAHRLGRRVYAGDADPERCRAAVAAAGLIPQPLPLHQN
ncbi:hypothetical protein XM38_019610 [Halomicronema hongdechloris C2206]|uniref:DUF3102 domain-containing protein n=1 Tax=Halomicronema hongdechloris C2206 TaxID=1641165 RepID=A0A1Z3HL22_9CYAN|nr:DUF3102 domain-containing protein [Halomicronema hongdechloris]ASC71012.1 hypothetical protein XM38_019610 [Halomicronema hongdechloris C2206]